ncbi:MAG TPA: DUF2231 domain-containing protein [Bacteroidales bacterium]|jgi:uncharacterized membrane protein|nr:DUF2231 domain-containing protein [Bacteroidales bacterium]
MFDSSHLHPMVVHFPIAIIMVGFLADIASLLFKKEKCLSTMGLYLEVLGVLAAIVAFGTGYFLTGEVPEEAASLREQHELFATLTLVAIILAAFFRILIVYLKKEETNLKYVAMGIFFLAFVFVGITGYLGGALVINYM